MFTPAPSSTHVRRQLITATSTIVVNPTSIGSAEESGDSVPIAAIAGGACGGVVLAVLAVIGWKWWGRQIKKKQQQRELEKRLAMARQSSLSSSTRRRSSRSLSESRRTSSESSKARLARPGMQQKPAINPPSDSIPPVPPLPPLDSISTPRPLKRRSGSASNEKEVRIDHKDGTALSTAPTRNTTRQGTAPPKGRSRLGSLDGKSYRPLRPSPLAAAGSPSSPSHYPRSADLSTPRQRQEKTSEPEPVAASTAASQPPPSSFGPRVKASLSSLTGEARRQSRASSHNSISDQSRHSGAGGSSRRWSWWSLINGRGLRQVGVGTGKNRISTATSICEDWQEEDPSVPIGYAYSGVDENNNEREPEKQSTNQNGDAFISSSKLERGA